MENDDMQVLVKELMKYFYSNKEVSREDLMMPNTSLPSDLSKNDFLQNLKVVVYTKMMGIYTKWETFLAMNFHNMLSSHEMYLRLLDVFALVMYFNMETFKSTGVNFCGLTSDMLMVYYDSNLKEQFFNHGGIERLAKYVSFHECLTWTWYWKDIASPQDTGVYAACIKTDLQNKIHLLLAKEIGVPEFISLDVVLSYASGLSLAQKVLSITKKQLPPLPTPVDLNAKLSVIMQEKRAKLEEAKRQVEHVNTEFQKFLKSESES